MVLATLKSLSFPRKIAIKNNKMYVATSGGLYARNLTTNSDINCSANVGSYLDHLNCNR